METNPTPPTISEAIAAHHHFPATLFGFTPNESAYWHEPGLPWLTPLNNPGPFNLDPAEALRQLQGLHSFGVRNENMAPRFPHGTWLAGRWLAAGQAVGVGEVLVWLEPGDAPDCFGLARVADTGPGGLRLRCDNGGHETRLPWGAQADPARRVWRITHYVTLPML